MSGRCLFLKYYRVVDCQHGPVFFVNRLEKQALTLTNEPELPDAAR